MQTTAGVANPAVQPQIVRNWATTMITANPSGGTKGPGIGSPTSRSARSPQPMERVATTKGNSAQAMIRSIWRFARPSSGQRYLASPRSFAYLSRYSWRLESTPWT
jgi:hypothetical protein